ncbi:conserved hypothetical protein [Histoplasma capsulatum G186AR]|uniref:Uncharacterized protein n=1 Tax=Ajellomyces capsulatus (strain G186AR / H82 / ATCC MYA-2454 / RMSCC 2432) TaxID=447093 RepID=C0NN97_AJECG|nr:uncharacterized protein HCBG_04224 [Histoplasma capsulatum G186AR]EEH07345.1 conserved hypothetical protein [Histoplasma capsulatum G186AR]
MDSMRSLNTSLPVSSPRSNYAQPPEQLLQAFKTAALSVTNLYKTAVSDQANARQIGYQEALEDLRAFLDKEKIGLSDGEGSKVRCWVTERIDGTGTTATSMDSDDERGELDNKRGGSISPTITRKQTPEVNHTNQAPRPTSPPRQETNTHPPSSTTAASSDTYVTPCRSTTFTFTTGPQFPVPQQSDVDMQTSEHVPATTTSLQTDSSHQPHSSAINSSPTVRVEVVPRGSRTPHRLNSGNRHGTRASVRDPASNNGSKRKFHFGDFFDISSLGNGRDAFGGGKRGRFI